MTQAHTGTKRRILIGVLSALLLIAGLSARSLWRSAHDLCVTQYTLTEDTLTAPLRIVQLTDLHNSVFGEDNERLIETVRAQQPDAIFLTGDMVNYPDADLSIAVHAVEQLSGIAPVYLSYGNHESEYEAAYGTDLQEVFSQAGAQVLDLTYTDTELSGQRVRIGGGYGYGLPESDAERKEREEWKQESRFLREFERTERCKLLLWHMPVSWSCYGSLDCWDADVVFSGHVHGGQVILPLIGGLYAPDQGWFPGRLWGLFRSKDGAHTLVLSRGLGNSNHLPRFNNVPEVVTVDLQPADS